MRRLRMSRAAMRRGPMEIVRKLTGPGGEFELREEAVQPRCGVGARL
jgi:hypothetical protein